MKAIIYIYTYSLLSYFFFVTHVIFDDVVIIEIKRLRWLCQLAVGLLRKIWFKFETIDYLFVLNFFFSQATASRVEHPNNL